MRHKYLNLGVLSTLLILFDQFTKYMVTSHVPLYASFRVIDKFFNITHIRN
ncbi:MAG: signal peptidase II, partial [Nitrospinaceae bacterium]|nr:signal peptidase II [Nitrospinaceae bacterium]NIR53425.1 signal peptidase II [Nitrospinaceae bacterium]NIS83829.1 signal peptidase II [Nitrospinaceae bacterium]NIT80620.1 signal peptidase II [Nitrospinaceae bacterium]NIU42944.1 signal peptidase II [Nitrospinaceae bacterium]